MDSEPLITPETNSRQIPRDEGVKLEKSGTIYRGMPPLSDSGRTHPLPYPHSSCGEGEGIHRIKTTGRLGTYIETNSTICFTALYCQTELGQLFFPLQKIKRSRSRPLFWRLRLRLRLRAILLHGSGSGSGSGQNMPAPAAPAPAPAPAPHPCLLGLNMLSVKRVPLSL